MIRVSIYQMNSVFEVNAMLQAQQSNLPAMTNEMPKPVCLHRQIASRLYNRLTDAEQNHCIDRAKPVPVGLMLKGVAEV